MTLYKCKECGVEFETEKSLHGHFRKHKLTVEEYYVKHFPRTDMYSDAPISFKSLEHYLHTDFNSPSNFKKWCWKEEPEVVKDYLVKKMKEKINDKGLSVVMGEVQLQTYGWPSVEDIKSIFGSYSAFCDEVGHPAQFGSQMPKVFYEDHTGKEVWVDTREQNGRC